METIDETKEELVLTTDVKYAVFTYPTTEFDGHKFGQFVDGAAIACLRLAYDARRGDAVSASLLEAFKVKIFTEDGKTCYWPMEAKPDAIVESSE